MKNSNAMDALFPWLLGPMLCAALVADVHSSRACCGEAERESAPAAGGRPVSTRATMAPAYGSGSSRDTPKSRLWSTR